MHPAVFIDWGPIEVAVSAYRLALVVAALVVVVGTAFFGIRRGVPPAVVMTAIVAGTVGAVIGARLLGAANTDTSLFAWSVGAFSIWGAIGGGSLGMLLALRVGWWRRPVPVGQLFDAAAVPVGLAIAVSRTGCLCAGCCFGMPTHAPWGVTYPRGSNAHVANLDSSGIFESLFGGPPAVHPVPVYDGGAAIVAALVAVWVHRRYVRDGSAAPGTVAAAFIAVYASARIVIETYRFPSD